MGDSCLMPGFRAHNHTHTHTPHPPLRSAMQRCSAVSLVTCEAFSGVAPSLAERQVDVEALNMVAGGDAAREPSELGYIGSHKACINVHCVGPLGGYASEGIRLDQDILDISQSPHQAVSSSRGVAASGSSQLWLSGGRDLQ